MIRFSLACDKGHVFESWFRDGASFDEQAERGLLSCPVCASAKVGKAIMAPQVARRDREPPPAEPARPVALVSPEEATVRVKLRELRVDGGASNNNLLMQFQADLLGVPVVRPQVTETTALGAAYLAGLGSGYWKKPADIATQWKAERRFEADMKPARRKELIAGWTRALERAKGA